MKVCFVSHSSAKGGAERALLELLEALEERGVRCYVLLPSNGPIVDELKKLGVDFCILPYKCWMGVNSPLWKRMGRTIINLAVTIPVAMRIKRWKCDVVYTNTITVCVGAFAASLLRIPHVWHIHEFGYEHHRLGFDLGEKLSLWLMNWLSSIFIANSNAVAQKYQQYIDPSKLRVIYQSVSVPQNISTEEVPVATNTGIRCVIVGALQEVGYFSAVYRIPGLLYRIPGTLAAAFYPRLFRVGAVNPIEHVKLSGRELKFMSIIGGGLALPFALYPDVVIRILFGTDWVEGGSQILAILVWVVVLQSINYPLADALTTKGLQARRTAVLIVAGLLGILSYITLGSRLGALGGAVAAMIVEGVLFLGYTISNPQGWCILKIGLPGSLTALFLTFFIILFLKPLITHAWLGIILTFFLYTALIITIDDDVKIEIKHVYSILNRKLAVFKKGD